jgi:cytolysin (calcineurin-like family phosphatase)
LHGQFVEEAEEILEQRIRYAQQNGQSHLHVIVGKGNHSVNHVQKIKPRVEQICRELGLQYNTEQNEGRMYIELKPTGNGPPQMPSYNYNQEPQHAQYGQPHHTTAYPMSGGYPGQQQNMQYGGQQQQQQQHQPQQQMGFQDSEQNKDDGIKICGIKICVVM